MADITVTQNVLVPMVREVHISRFPAGNKNDFSAFIFNVATAAGNSSVKQETTKHHQENQFFLHRIPLPNCLDGIRTTVWPSVYLKFNLK